MTPDSRHYQAPLAPPRDSVADRRRNRRREPAGQPFKNILLEALDQVNSMQQQADAGGRAARDRRRREPGRGADHAAEGRHVVQADAADPQQARAGLPGSEQHPDLTRSDKQPACRRDNQITKHGQAGACPTGTRNGLRQQSLRSERPSCFARCRRPRASPRGCSWRRSSSAWSICSSSRSHSGDEFLLGRAALLGQRDDRDRSGLRPGGPGQAARSSATAFAFPAARRTPTWPPWPTATPCRPTSTSTSTKRPPATTRSPRRKSLELKRANAKMKELALIISRMQGIESATVQFDEEVKPGLARTKQKTAMVAVWTAGRLARRGPGQGDPQRRRLGLCRARPADASRSPT